MISINIISNLIRSPYLVVILRWRRRHVLEMSPHVHVLHGPVGGAGVGVDPHPLHLLYW